MRGTTPGNQIEGGNRVVGVIAVPAALARATRLRQPPDLFELRLDALRGSLGEIERVLPRLRAPLIVTARHPAEGGRGASLPCRAPRLASALSHRRRLSSISSCDRVRQMPALLDEIAAPPSSASSFPGTDLRGTPSLGELQPLRPIRRSPFSAAIFKIATRTEHRRNSIGSSLFSQKACASLRSLPWAWESSGRIAPPPRSASGSVLTYASLGRADASRATHLSRQLRRARRAYII